MATEIERKWLLKGGDFNFPDDVTVIREQIWQYYLDVAFDANGNVEREIRIRYKAGSNNGRLTFKSGNGLERIEIEDKLFSARKFVAKIAKESGKPAIKKERYTLIGKDRPIEICIVDEAWSYAEVEFDSVEDAKNYIFPFPDMVATEVTGMTMYSMAGYWHDTRE